MKLLIGGSPCTYWSIAQTKNRETEASGMGWELFRNYVIARDKMQPDYFLYENNKSMSPAIRAQITEMLGVEPVLINSALVSAQNRQRLYWCGKREADGSYSTVPIEQPEDRGILLRDVLESGVCWREKAYCLRSSEGGKIADSHAVRTIMTGGKEACDGVAEPVNVTVDGKARTIIAQYDKQSIENVIGSRGFGTSGAAESVCVASRGRYIGEGGSVAQHYEVQESGKTNTLATVQKDNMIAEPVAMMRVKEATAKGYTDIAPGECVDLAQENSKTRRGRRMAEKSNCLTTTCSFYEYCGTLDYPIYQVKDGLITIKGKQYPIKLRDGCYIIRKLTVRECMRLQTVPENFEFPVSNSQAYKMLGNGWTVDVIVHLLSHFDGIMTEPVDVLSMYDGMACGHIALDKLGANIRNYYATEIDKYAIKTALHNFPDIVELGDANQIRDQWRHE